MTLAQVRLSGCDDSTRFVLDLTDDETAFLHRVSAASKAASSYSCQPRLIIEPPDTGEDTP